MDDVGAKRADRPPELGQGRQIGERPDLAAEVAEREERHAGQRLGLGEQLAAVGAGEGGGEAAAVEPGDGVEGVALGPAELEHGDRVQHANPMTGVRGPGSGVHDSGTGVRGPGSGVHDTARAHGAT